MTAKGNQESVRIAPFELQTEAVGQNRRGVIDNGARRWPMECQPAAETLKPANFRCRTPRLNLNGRSIARAVMGDSLILTADWALQGTLALATAGNFRRRD